MQKRGIAVSIEFLVTVILILIFAIAVFVWFGQLPGTFAPIKYQSSCRLSVESRDRTIQFTPSLMSTEDALARNPLQCTQNFITFQKGSKTGITKGSGSNILTIEAENEEALKKLLADELVSCFWRMGEGKKKFTTSSNLVCVPCAEITFNGFNNQQDTLDINSYMSTEFKPPQTTSNTTYTKYLPKSTLQLFTWEEGATGGPDGNVIETSTRIPYTTKPYTFSKSKRNSVFFIINADTGLAPEITEKLIANNIVAASIEENTEKGFTYGLVIGETASIYNICDQYITKN